MKIVDLHAQSYTSVSDYGAQGSESLAVAAGAGAAHVHTLRIQRDGVIGPHEAGFGQLFVVLSGLGWVAGDDAVRVALKPGQAAFIRRGELHSKGATEALVALVLQVHDLDLLARAQ